MRRPRSITSRRDASRARAGRLCSTIRKPVPCAASVRMRAGDLVDQHGIDPGERLVQQDVARLRHQRPAEFQQLLLAAGERAGRRGRLRFEAEEVEQRVAFARSRAPARDRAGAEQQVEHALAGLAGAAAIRFSRTERCRNGRGTWNVRAMPRRARACGRQAPDRLAAEPDVAEILALVAGDDREQRALAGAVRPDQPGDGVRLRPRR